GLEEAGRAADRAGSRPPDSLRWSGSQKTAGVSEAAGPTLFPLAQFSLEDFERRNPLAHKVDHFFARQVLAVAWGDAGFDRFAFHSIADAHHRRLGNLGVCHQDFLARGDRRSIRL